MSTAYSHPVVSLGGVSVDDFLREYWQQKPLLARGALKNFQSPISADELAGYALEPEVESRLIDSRTWGLRHGPFAETDFDALPAKGWTLLVQGVDQLNDAVAALLEGFDFLPSWRLDDIMVSFAADGGSVGPHFDHYDVFLLQATGKRRWQVGQWCDEQTPLLVDTDLSILRTFNKTQQWLLEPGDMLYLPPKLAHWGIADGDCMTFSIGFRAPSASEIVSHYCDYVLEHLKHNPRYRDPPLVADNRYEISQPVIDQVRDLLEGVLNQPDELRRWFGAYMTTSRYESECPANKLPFDENKILQKFTDLRVAYSTSQHQGEAFLFINGRQWSVTQNFAQRFCEQSTFSPVQLAETDGEIRLLEEFYRLGFVKEFLE